ncbi:MAG: sugar phosphate isomerase/epimerase [Victivallales bacterium]|nr:sugar phosphate isomerase/epimerase [Victivallales bacterium]
MHSYALSLACVGSYVTAELAEALRKSSWTAIEVSSGDVLFDETPEGLASVRRTRELIKEGVLKTASLHMPFGYPRWRCFDPSALDEDMRRTCIRNMTKLVRENADLIGQHITIHASGEPPQEEHPQYMAQFCRSMEELLPLAEEYNFSFNVEFLPRTCIGNCVEELQYIMDKFPTPHLGICFDVNHIMNRHKELPAMIDTLAPRIRSFHISDYDGVDERHWMPGQGIIDWPAVMKSIRKIDHDVLLIFETCYQLANPYASRPPVDPLFSLRQNEKACWYMENCDQLNLAFADFKVPTA